MAVQNTAHATRLKLAWTRFVGFLVGQSETRHKRTCTLDVTFFMEG